MEGDDNNDVNLTISIFDQNLDLYPDRQQSILESHLGMNKCRNPVCADFDGSAQLRMI
jgi:hypothetical protein